MRGCLTGVPVAPGPTENVSCVARTRRAFSVRLTNVTQSFFARSHRVVEPSATAGDGMGTFQSATFWNGPLKPSRTRSNCTPIWNASVHPALSYGGVGGAPGYGITFG